SPRLPIACVPPFTAVLRRTRGALRGFTTRDSPAPGGRTRSRTPQGRAPRALCRPCGVLGLVRPTPRAEAAPSRAGAGSPTSSADDTSLPKLIEPPARLEVPRQRLPRQPRPHQLDRHVAAREHRIMERPRAHLPRAHELRIQRPELQRAHHVGELIQRPIIAVERPPHLRLGVLALVADSVDQEVDALLRGHLAQVETEREL